VTAIASRIFHLAKSTGKHFNRVFFHQLIDVDFNDAVFFGSGPGEGGKTADASAKSGQNDDVTIEIEGENRKVSKFWGVKEMRALIQGEQLFFIYFRISFVVVLVLKTFT
jgi:hypothetical protein